MIAVAVALVLIATGATTGQRSVPTAENFAACNAEARDALKSGGDDAASASPITRDRQNADGARRGEPNPADDPQLAGIDPEGAKHPAYQAAYRTCMRKTGF
jgi:hypothetical protein